MVRFADACAQRNGYFHCEIILALPICGDLVVWCGNRSMDRLGIEAI